MYGRVVLINSNLDCIYRKASAVDWVSAFDSPFNATRNTLAAWYMQKDVKGGVYTESVAVGDTSQCSWKLTRTSIWSGTRCTIETIARADSIQRDFASVLISLR